MNQNTKNVLIGVLATLAAAGVAAPFALSSECDDTEVEIAGQCVEVTDTQALQLALSSMPESAWMTPVELTPGATYDIDSTLYLTRPVHIRGNGAVLRAVSAGYPVVHVTHGAAGSAIDNLRVRGQRQNNSTDPGGVGIRIEAGRVALRNVEINFVGTGLLVIGCTGGDPGCYMEEPAYQNTCTSDDDCPSYGRCATAGDGNEYCRGRTANLTRVDRLHVSRCDRGVVVQGYDASAGLFEGVSVVNCTAGILDDGFTGSTWTAPHIAGITCEEDPDDRECYSWLAADSTSYGMLIGGYVEAAPVVHSMSSRAMVIGGNSPLKIHPEFGGAILDPSRSRLGFQATATHPNGSQSYIGPQIRLPGPYGSGILAQWQDADGPWFWLYYGNPASGNGSGDGKFRLSRRSPPTTLWQVDQEP